MTGVKKIALAATIMAATIGSASDTKIAAPKVNVPFNFRMGVTELPAGEYNVRVLGTVVVLTDANGQSVSVGTHGVQAATPIEKSALEFVNVNGTRQLYRLWHAGTNGGEELSLAPSPKRIAEAGGASRIPLGK